MIEHTQNENSGLSDEVNILVFEIMDGKFGINTNQIYSMLEPEQVDGTEYDISQFHETVPFREDTVVYKLPKAILLRDDEGSNSGIIIDRPGDIISVHLDSIHPMPELIECNSTGIIWGVILRDNNVIMLVDFDKIIACREKS